LKIVADQNMPLAEDLFSPYGEVRLMPGRDICAADIRDADALLVRSVTQINRQLLDGSSVKFVGSATIGTDHIDQEYLASAGIQFAHAPGCNAESVVQYDLSVMCRLVPDWRQKTVGIVGCGNVGGRLYQRLCDLGVRCKVYDPFLSSVDIPDIGNFDRILDCDIICLHTPITVDGAFPTKHLFDRHVLAKLRPDSLLINAGRGAVIDNKALLEAFQAGYRGKVALDVWETEPRVDTELMSYVALATPHIAGYSQEGKRNGTEMVYRAFMAYLAQQPTSELGRSETSHGALQVHSLNEAILGSYDVALDDQRMRAELYTAQASGNLEAVAEGFDRLRRDYPVRRECSYYSVSKELKALSDYRSLGFIVL
jgi:erythronate-4-phosphate dehydrogenase